MTVTEVLTYDTASILEFSKYDTAITGLDLKYGTFGYVHMILSVWVLTYDTITNVQVLSYDICSILYLLTYDTVIPVVQVSIP